MKNYSQQIFISPLFLLGLFILLLNDFALKALFHNFLTGKISDFAGIFIFPIFLSAFFPRKKILIYVLTGFLFIFWKSPFSESFVNLFNSFQFMKIGRTIDYSDLLALSVLPFSYYYFQTESQKQKIFPSNFAKQILVSFVVLLSVFAFTATSYVEDRSVSIKGEYQFKLSREEIENILKQNERITGIRVQRHSDIFPAANYPDVKTDTNVFFVDFSLKQKICDSDYPVFSFSIRQEKNFSSVKALLVHFKCKEESMKPDTNSAIKQYEQKLSNIFEREVI